MWLTFECFEAEFKKKKNEPASQYTGIIHISIELTQFLWEWATLVLHGFPCYHDWHGHTNNFKNRIDMRPPSQLKVVNDAGAVGKIQSGLMFLNW